MIRKDEKGRVMDGNDPEAYFIELERKGDVEDYRGLLGDFILMSWEAYHLFFERQMTKADFGVLWLVQSQRHGCSRNNAFIAQVLGLSTVAVKRARARLFEWGLLEEATEEGVRVLRSRKLDRPRTLGTA